MSRVFNWVMYAVFLVSISVVNPAHSNWEKEVSIANDKGDEKKAFNILLAKAKEGIPEAQARVGLNYQIGWGVKKDKRQALKWFQRAAEKGNLSAHLRLGEFYFSGAPEIGISQNYSKAADLLKAPANAGMGAAQTTLAKMYANGLGVQKDPVKAYILYGVAREKLPEILRQRYAEKMKKISASLSPDKQRLAEESLINAKLNRKVRISYSRGFYHHKTWNFRIPEQTRHLRFLQKLPRSRDKEVISWIKENQQYLNPVFLYEMARRLFTTDVEAALEWAQVGRLRSLYDALRCTDSTSVQGTRIIRGNAKNVFIYGMENKDAFKKSLLKAIERNDLFTENVSPKWICSHGIKSFTAEGQKIWLVDPAKWEGIKQEIIEKNLAAIQ